MSVSATGPSQVAAAESERDARDRIARATKAAEEAERDSEFRIDHVKDSFIRQTEAESARGEARTESEKTKGYTALGELKKNQQAELSRVKRDGETELNRDINYYRDTVYNTEKHGNQDLQGVKNANFVTSEYERKRFNDEFNMNRENHAKQIHDQVDEQERVFGSASTSAKDEREKMSAKTSAAIEKATQGFQDKYTATTQEYDQVLEGLNSKTSQQLHQVRKDNAQKLDAYSDRAGDPFYKMVNVGARIRESSDAFFLTAKVPPHERDTVNVSVKGDSIMISGHRKNEEKLELEPGHNQSTATFQAFTESFPINWPVDARKLTREFDGDTMIVRIPKKLTYDPGPYKAKKQAERVRVERPDFPGNLPVAQGASEDSDDPKAKKSPGSRPLSS